eukprot:1315275-Rhodomonas_salina.1
MAVLLTQRVIVGIDRGEPDGQRVRLQAVARRGQPRVRDACGADGPGPRAVSTVAALACRFVSFQWRVSLLACRQCAGARASVRGFTWGLLCGAHMWAYMAGMWGLHVELGL